MRLLCEEYFYSPIGIPNYIDKFNPSCTIFYTKEIGMHKKSFSLVLMTLLIISLSCNFITRQAPGSGPTPIPSGTPLSATDNGPSGLTAQATSSDSVKLIWKPVNGAKSYQIKVSTNGGEALPVVDLAPSVTSYEDFMASRAIS